MREIVQIISLADPITVKVRSGKKPASPTRKMKVEGNSTFSEGAKDLLGMEAAEPEKPATESVTTQIVALVQDGKHRFVEPVLVDADGGLLPVGDIDSLEVVDIVY